MKDNNIISYVFSSFTVFMGTIDFETIKSFILFGLGVISFIVSISYTIWKWYKKSKSDGKITIEEVGELIETVKKETDQKNF